MPFLYFLEITCTAAILTCLGSPPNHQIPRYYNNADDCAKAAIVAAYLWDPGPNGAYKFDCLPITKQGR